MLRSSSDWLPQEGKCSLRNLPCLPSPCCTAATVSGKGDGMQQSELRSCKSWAHAAHCGLTAAAQAGGVTDCPMPFTGRPTRPRACLYRLMSHCTTT